MSVLSVNVHGQFEGQFTQYMETKANINPAAVGEQQMMEVLAAQRLQWLGIVGAPKTTLFLANTPFKIGTSTHAGGVQLVSDIYGLFANQQINLQYAYKHEFDDITLSVGVNLGVLNIILNGDSVKMVESDYHTNNDPAVPMNKQSGVRFDMGLGVYVSGERFYAGISVLHLPGSKIYLGDRYQFKVTQHYTAMGGYNFKLYNADYQIKPSALLVTDMVSWQMYLSCLLDYKERFWGGLTYSLENADSFAFGMEVIPGFKFGYTYDLPTNSIIRTSSCSHVLFVSYAFNLCVHKRARKQ